MQEQNGKARKERNRDDVIKSAHVSPLTSLGTPLGPARWLQTSTADVKVVQLAGVGSEFACARVRGADLSATRLASASK